MHFSGISKRRANEILYLVNNIRWKAIDQALFVLCGLNPFVGMCLRILVMSTKKISCTKIFSTENNL